jgi:hypothetical protein
MLGIVFVYFVLDWRQVLLIPSSESSFTRGSSAFVGLAVMVLLLPVPAKIASWMTGYQDAKMNAVSLLRGSSF